MLFPHVSFSLALFPSSLLFLQVDNRPCSRPPSTCFPYATEAASFLRAVILLRPTLFSNFPELMAIIISIRGVREEIGSRDGETEITEVKGRLTCPVSNARTCTHPALNPIQTKQHKTPFRFHCVHVWQVSVLAQTFNFSLRGRAQHKLSKVTKENIWSKYKFKCLYIDLL